TADGDARGHLDRVADRALRAAVLEDEHAFPDPVRVFVGQVEAIPQFAVHRHLVEVIDSEDRHAAGVAIELDRGDLLVDRDGLVEGLLREEYASAEGDEGGRDEGSGGDDSGGAVHGDSFGYWCRWARLERRAQHGNADIGVSPDS